MKISIEPTADGLVVRFTRDDGQQVELAVSENGAQAEVSGPFIIQTHGVGDPTLTVVLPFAEPGP